MSQDSSLSASSTLTATPFPADEILHFAYGPTMSPTTMQSHCPSAVPVSLAYLPGWRWIINSRGVANIVRLLPSAFETYLRESASGGGGSGSEAGSDREVLRGEDGVYGVLYLLPEREEGALDVCEGVEEGIGSVGKAVLEVEMAARTPGFVSEEEGMEVEEEAVRVQVVRALVYVDGESVEEGRPGREYVERLNRGIAGAVGDWGMPGWYVDGVLRRFVPGEEEHEDEGVGMEE